MKRLTNLLIVFLLPFTALSQTYWAQTQMGGNVDETLAIASDGSGNTYLTGYFSTGATINGDFHSVSGLTDVFLTKTTMNGTSEWVVSFGSSSSDRGLDVAVDGAGNVYVCGFFKGNMNLGNGVTLSSNGGSQDAFVAKFNASGQALWAKAGGSSGDADQARGVDVDGSGNVFITGQFSGEGSFGAFTVNSEGGNDAFTAKYDSNGNEVWAKSGGGGSNDWGVGIAADGQGNAYVVGQMNGDVVFGAPYSNTILNALFLIKYSSSGNEEWFRWAGGSDQTVAGGIDLAGSSVYITGDMGSQITFLGGSSDQSLNSAYDNSIFVVSYSTSGGYSWGSTEGSSSGVSSRGIQVSGSDIAIAGWYRCTFESVSENYGEGIFNSLGGRDAYVLHMTGNGGFNWARNFGSSGEELANGVAIMSDGVDVVAGTFSSYLVLPSMTSAVTGANPIPNAPNFGLTYCGDPNYGVYTGINGENGENGFAVKVLTDDREPMDIYQRYGSGCDRDIPETCIDYTGVMNETCTEELIGCAPYSVQAVNQVINGSQVGFDFGVSWSPPGSGHFNVNSAQTITATWISSDGCYSGTATADVDVHPTPDEPLISDNVGINDQALVPMTVYLCPGEEVTLTGTPGPGTTYHWTGPGITPPDDGNVGSITVDEEGWYSFIVENEFGCQESNFVEVEYHDVPLELQDPSFEFGLESDTLLLCEMTTAGVTLIDPAYDGNVISQGWIWSWEINDPASIGDNSNSVGFSTNESGWYTITLELESEENVCLDDIYTYTIEDSVYVEVAPAPDTEISLAGPGYICPGDTFMLHFDYIGQLDISFEYVELFDDSVLVTGTGLYGVVATDTTDLGCVSTSTASLTVQEVSSPNLINTDPVGVICPNDSILLIAQHQGGTLSWIGPNGVFATDTNQVYVFDGGEYYLELEFYEGCGLVSNTVEIDEYSTPYLAGSNAVLCEGETVEISVVSAGDAVVQWLAPLSGEGPTQIISEPGIYSAQIESCDITTLVEIQVDVNESTLEITQPNTDPVCDGDSILIQATPFYSNYDWSPNAPDDFDVYIFQSGPVQVTALDTNNCTITSNVIDLFFNPVPLAPAFEYELVCEGEDQVIVVPEPNGNQLWFTDGVDGEIVSDTGYIFISNFLADTTFYAYYTNEFCTGPLSIVDLGPKPFPDDPILATDAPACTGSTFALTVLNSDGVSDYIWNGPDNYQGQGDDLTVPAVSLDDQGVYWCYADLNGCLSDTLPILIDLLETIHVVLPSDTGFCFFSNYVVNPPGSFTTYTWQDGSNDSIYSPLESGVITLSVEDANGCPSSDSFHIELIDCTIDIPNVFTPNGDGSNDFWFFSIEEPQYFEITVYNRWGRMVFQSNNEQVMWDGKNFKSDEWCTEGVYFYVMRATDYDGVNIDQTGDVTIVYD